MQNDFQKGLATGLALKPPQVTTSNISSDIFNYQFNDHNLLADKTLLVESAYWSFDMTGESVILNMTGNVRTKWYTLTSSLDFLKKNHMYKIEAPTFGYGRIALAKSPIWDPCGFRAACAWPAIDTVLICYPYPMSAYFVPIEESLSLWFCSDRLINGQKNSYSTSIAIYEQL